MRDISARALTFAVLVGIALYLHLSLVGLASLQLTIISAFLIAVMILRLANALHAVLVFALAALIGAVPALRDSIGQMPVLPLLVPLILSILFIWSWSSLRPTLDWTRRGAVDRVSAMLIVLTGLGSAGALVVWATWTDNFGIGEQMMQNALGAPLWSVALIGLPIFAVFNAATEEAVFRGVFQTALMRISIGFPVANTVQAAAFAAFHFAVGFPNGYVGYVMVFVYGLVLGYLRQRTGGLLAPIATHIIADLVIGYVMLVTVVTGGARTGF